MHEVTTNDGYILQMHRISGGPKSPPQKGKTPVLLMHGLLDSSATWVIMRPYHGLGEKFQSTHISPFCVENRPDENLLFTIAYLLADQGYDVWMGNARGNTYSRRHVKFNPDGWRWQRKEFWSFSWHEIGVFDLPAMIDYVLAQSEKSKLHYIGHSQGTTAFFVMCSQRPEYNDKIIMMNALAPVAYAKHIKSPVVRAFTPFLYTLDVNFVVHFTYYSSSISLINSLNSQKLSSLLGAYELLPSCELFILGGKAACRDQAITQEMCENILFLIAGYSSDQLNAVSLLFFPQSNEFFLLLKTNYYFRSLDDAARYSGAYTGWRVHAAVGALWPRI